jgi:succinate dehydrogenase/fumarate reductase flavoprotein subunit
MEQTAVNSGRSWDLEADIVIVGSGAAGLPAAIKAVEGGASVIVVETNYDVGGHAIISGGHMALGGGTSAQKKIRHTRFAGHGLLGSHGLVHHPTQRLARLPLQRSGGDAGLRRSLRAYL